MFPTYTYYCSTKSIRKPVANRKSVRIKSRSTRRLRDNRASFLRPALQIVFLELTTGPQDGPAKCLTAMAFGGQRGMLVTVEMVYQWVLSIGCLLVRFWGFT